MKSMANPLDTQTKGLFLQVEGKNRKLSNEAAPFMWPKLVYEYMIDDNLNDKMRFP